MIIGELVCKTNTRHCCRDVDVERIEILATSDFLTKSTVAFVDKIGVVFLEVFTINQV